ncbi:unnamed protein product [Stenotrophomonas maltophilia]|nr:unnamed protein product [Stenotrophomonas maltophilia]
MAPTRSESSACLWWVRTVGPHCPSDTCAPALRRPTVGTHLKRITRASPGAPVVGANFGWHLPGASHRPAFGGCGPLVRTALQTPVPQHCADQRSAPTLRGSLGPALERLWWVRTVGPHCLHIPVHRHCADQRSAPTLRGSPEPALKRLWWVRTVGPHYPSGT